MSGVRGADGAYRDIASISVRDAASVQKAIGFGFVRDATDALKQFFGGFSATAAPAEKAHYKADDAPIDIPVIGFMATAAGGADPKTYLWERTDANPETWTIDDPTAATTSFTAVAVPAGDTVTATFECTVTDATGTDAVTNEVTASATNFGGTGGGL